MPNPGSLEAIIEGCTCPIRDNDYGAGIINDDGDVVFFVAEDCPTHGYVYQPPPAP